ncbi:MAG: preprotein translocase subunit YajC [candidate division Zixibacteria bacterium]|nr:preprotein translocase subunit YajC [candidate division Zixibacteria bacterium]
MWLGMAPSAPAGGGSANPILTFLPFVLMIGVVWFLLIRPQRKRQKEHQSMISQLTKGDEVVTNSGILGTIIGFNEKKNTVTLRVGEDSRSETKIEFLKSAIAGRVEVRA